MRTSGKQAALLSLILATAPFARIAGQVAAPSPAATPAPGAPPIRLMLTSLKPDAVIESGPDRRITVTADAVWLTHQRTGTIARIDPKTNSLGTAVAAGSGPCWPVLSAFKGLWVALCGAKALAKFDASAEKPPVVTPVDVRAAGPLVMAAGSVWMVTDTAGTLARIDPDTNAAVAEVPVPPGAIGLATGMGAVWVTSSTTHVVTRVNAGTNVVLEAIKVGRSPVSVAVGEGSVWTFNGGDGTVSRIDPATNKVTETIKIGVTAVEGTVIVGEGSVWVSAPGTPLTRIDPASNRMVQQFTGPGGGALAIGLKSLWLGATPAAVWRVDPKRVEATRK